MQGAHRTNGPLSATAAGGGMVPPSEHRPPRCRVLRGWVRHNNGSQLFIAVVLPRRRGAHTVLVHTDQATLLQVDGMGVQATSREDAHGFGASSKDTLTRHDGRHSFSSRHRRPRGWSRRLPPAPPFRVYRKWRDRHQPSGAAKTPRTAPQPHDVRRRAHITVSTRAQTDAYGS